MATTSSSGAIGGSVLDVQSLVSQLVAAERAPYDTRVKRETEKVTTQISAIGALKGALSTFQIALNAFNTQEKFDARSTLSSDDKVFTASATSTAVPGKYSIEVLSLAQAHQIGSLPKLTGATTVIGTGTLTLSTAGLGFNVTITDANKTMAGIRDAINAAPDNTGVRASLINTADGTRLVLAATKPGEVNAITVAQTGGDGGLAQLAYAPGNLGNYTQLAEAMDASIEVAGFPVESTTNTITGVIEGVTINLASAKPGTVLTLTVDKDSNAVKDKIKGFVNAYNALEAQIVKLRSYDAITKTGGPMLGDALVTGLETQLRRTLSNAVGSGTYNTLASLGITTQVDGSLALNEGKLDKALAENYEGVTALFLSADGVATRLTSDVKARLAADGAIAGRSSGLVKRQTDLTKQQSDIDLRMQMVQARYLKQFSALDALLSSLQSTSSALGQQIDSLPSNNNLNN